MISAAAQQTGRQASPSGPLAVAQPGNPNDGCPRAFQPQLPTEWPRATDHRQSVLYTVQLYSTVIGCPCADTMCRYVHDEPIGEIVSLLHPEPAAHPQPVQTEAVSSVASRFSSWKILVMAAACCDTGMMRAQVHQGMHSRAVRQNRQPFTSQFPSVSARAPSQQLIPVANSIQ